MEHTQDRVTHYDFINALRGFAILAVIFHHTGKFYQPAIHLIELISENSKYGVQLFYIVSALTLFLSLAERSHEENSKLRDFFIRRFFRIAPLFYLALIVYSILYFAGSDSPPSGLQESQHYWSPSGIQWWYMPLTALFLNGWMPETINSIIPVGWSIAVEMTFYLFVPLLFKKLKDVKSTILFILLTLILQSVLAYFLKPYLFSFYAKKSLWPIPENFLYFWFFAQLPVFGLGILTFQIFRETRVAKDTKLGIALLSIAFLFFIDLLQMNTFLGILSQYFVYSIAFVCFTLALHYAPLKLFVNPLTCWIGKVSFSLYLVHFLILDIFVDRFPNGILALGRTAEFFLFFLAITLGSCAVAYFTYHYVEVPGMNLGKTIIRRSTGTK